MGWWGVGGGGWVGGGSWVGAGENWVGWGGGIVVSHVVDVCEKVVMKGVTWKKISAGIGEFMENG